VSGHAHDEATNRELAALVREALSWAHYPLGQPQFHRSDTLDAFDRLVARLTVDTPPAANLREELLHTAAVAVAWAESLAAEVSGGTTETGEATAGDSRSASVSGTDAMRQAFDEGRVLYWQDLAERYGAALERLAGTEALAGVALDLSHASHAALVAELKARASFAAESLDPLGEEAKP
jgi:hypothetical protein